jgi:ribosomal-protein-alanine N-acetyltransferase
MLEPNFSPFPVLTTERLILRQLTFTDAPALFVVRSNADIMQYIARPLAKTVIDAVNLIKVINDSLNSNNGITWCITLKNNPQFIGSIGFWRIEKENYRAEIGYLLNPAFQGMGIMQEAIAAVMNLHSIQANADPRNTASIKLLEKNNFIREGYFKEDHFYNEAFADTVVYTLLTKSYMC